MMTNHFKNQKKVMSYEKTVTTDKNRLLKPRCLFVACIFLLSLLNATYGRMIKRYITDREL